MSEPAVSDATAALLAQARAAREVRCELGGGRVVWLLRPTALQMARLRGGFGIEELAGAAVRWEGFRVCDLVGESAEPLQVDPALWRAMVEDNAQWLNKCVDALAEAMKERLKRMEDAEGN